MSGLSLWQSATLVLVSQIPFILKLYLDHRARRDPYRNRLFQRQMEEIEKIYAALIKAHFSLYGVLKLFRESEPGSAWNDTEREIYQSHAKMVTQLLETIDSAELLLPTGMLLPLRKYEGLLSGSIVKITLEPTKFRSQHNQYWEEMQELFNSTRNMLRGYAGVDKLSQEALHVIFAGKATYSTIHETLSLEDNPDHPPHNQ